MENEVAPKKSIWNTIGKIAQVLAAGVIIASKADIIRGWLGSKAKNFETKDTKEL